MTYQTEFADFDIDVAIPFGFSDASWGNDVCPHWESAELGLELWVDYADQAAREFPGGRRFNLMARADHLEATEGLYTDDYEEVLAYIAGRRLWALAQGGR